MRFAKCFVFAVAGIAASGSIADDRMMWSLRETEGPAPRAYPTIAYDNGRHVTVLFGGGDELTTFSDTWEWNGLQWVFRTEGSPPKRFRHGMAYHESRAQVVMYGGAEEDDGVNYDERTWLWDGSNWTSVDDALLAGRYRHAMAYDAARSKTVSWGGTVFGEGTNDSTHLWDGGPWEFATSGFPPGSTYPGMCFDRRRTVMVLFGGSRSGSGTDDTFEWDGSVWTQVAGSGPAGRYGHGMAYDIRRGKTVLFGGQIRDGRIGDDTWEWDGTTWTPVDVAGPSGRRFISMAYDAGRDVCVLFGGETQENSGQSAETWEYGPDCNGNGEPDWADIASGASADRDGDIVPDECEPCEFIERFKVKTKESRGRCKIRASALTTLPEGTELTICFEGDTDCGCQTVTINDRGRAKASCITLIKGDHRVCIQECPDLCRTVTCQP